MSNDLCQTFVKDFLKSAWICVKAIVDKVAEFHGEAHRNPVSLFKFEDGKKVDSHFDGNNFFLRSSVEYSNPQLTLEEVQGIIGTRLLETCGNYFSNYGLNEPNANDVSEICEALKKPSGGPILPFLLNTDEIEPDRYSMNPLKGSIVTSGQSAFPVAYVKTERLNVDPDFVRKYEGKLISRNDLELIDSKLKSSKGNYLDFVDSVKYSQMEEFSKTFGIDLKLYSLRMPLATLQIEPKDGLLHYIISEAHRDYESISEAYSCMGRSMTKRRTLLTVPHSPGGFGSKRAARGKIHFEGSKLTSVSVKYKTTRLYPNEIDPEDVSIAKAESSFTILGNMLSDYSFSETPSSPQFFLYSLDSPEDAVLWHGIGAFASPKLLRSYVCGRKACTKRHLFKDIKEKYRIKTDVPLQFNLSPSGMWVHPLHHNIDASIGCVENPTNLVLRGMKIETLSTF